MPRRDFFYCMDKTKKEKLNMWKTKLIELEKELEVAMKKKGEAAQMGDLSENAAYQLAVEDAETLRARIDEIKKIISDLETK